MLTLIRFMMFLLPLLASAQTAWPPCPEGSGSWHQCFGRYKSTIDGTIFVGEWEGNLRNGSGIEYSSSGRKMKSGLWKDGKLVSQFLLDEGSYPLHPGLQTVTPSVLTANSSQEVTLPPCGEQHASWSNCVGRYFSAINSTVYVGEWQNNMRNGRGIEYGQSGTLLRAGVWRDNKFVAEMRLNSNIYAFNSNAKLETSNVTNVQSVSQFSQNKCSENGIKDNCWGELTFISGGKYVGQFKNNKFDGIGEFTHATKGKYIGEWRNGSRNGQGIEYQPNGRVWQTGEWVDDKLVFSFIVDVNRFLAYASNSEKSEIDRLREEAELFKKKQIELEEQLRLALTKPNSINQIVSIPPQGRRIALVMGNSGYKIRPLRNSRNDADDMSRTLRASGFETIDLRDANLNQMRMAIRQFGDKLLNYDVGLVYYSGHGAEVKGRNYFIPINADIQREDEIVDQSIDVSLILEKMNTAQKGVNILIVDACRDDPFGRGFRSGSRGLAQMDAPRGTIIAYATSPGKVASDGDPRERNSPYTKHLLRAMQFPNKPIEQVFKEVRRAVQSETRDQQTPWENTSLSGDFYFKVQK